MTKEISGIPADRFKWKGNHGYTTVDKLGFMPGEFFSFSPKTMRIKHFKIDQEDAGFEDHWDGVMCKFVDSEKKFSITIHYEEPWI